jgi:hypothetical protein
MGRMDFELSDRARTLGERLRKFLKQQFGHALSNVEYAPLAWMCACRRLRLADGPDEVHKMVIARRELKPHARPDDGHSQ